ncbi:hypothetical protein BFJ63_vAg12664 [Fusarium oxysporum f. sp. narcissi]|uniref:Uncharacterized protein n=2 Tax=Fusarium oxysporum TaxID=5507 RepID=A0A4Q2VAI7_FUSOX|nr:hypothetical protein FOZG_12111 [Fusarium oxysporum Fo47]EWZ79947.1 hypothetical protein FOWG_15970 [Fusarium oxysporum f. sp. lycopersici MN25]RYC84455.1 hypothetical protein BFJ63_vAg12664 [Fusarium oxysporum f. sp. narcissi]
MEPIGLAIGVVGLVGLFSSCLEAADKVQAYLSFGTESGVLDARFRATKVLLEKWGRRVGLEKTTLAEDHHPALDDRDIAAAVEDVLRIINTICEPSNQSIPQSKLTPSLVDGVSLGSIGPPSLHGMRRRKLTWALWGKGKRTDQVELLETLVQQLNNLVPPDATDMLSSGKAPGHASLAELQRILARIEEVHRAETRREVYSWLDRSIPNEHYDDSIQKKLVGTCDWIFERVVFQNWLSSEFTVGAKLLWINGPAGFGKTIICANIVDHLVPTLMTPVAHFFFSSELENREDPFLAIRSWISQIASQHEPAYKHVRRVWEQDLDFVSTRLTAISLFAQLLHIVPNCTLIADGLDECTHLDDSNASVAKFLRIVAGAVDGTNTRVLVVSRDEPQIRHAITDNALWSFDEYKISRHDVRSDTAAYSRHIINRKLPNKNDVVRSTLSEAMADRCEGQFLWLKMQEESLRKGLNMKQLRRAIEETPAGLHGLYDRNWSRIKNCRDRERIFSLLRWAAFALRPLTVCEITEAVLITDSDDLPVDDLPDTVDGDYVDSEIVDLCGPLIQVRRQKSDGSAGQQTVHLAHFSVRQFLLVNLPTPGWISENERLRANYQNTLLARACLYYINFERVWQEITDHASSLGTALRNYAAGAWHHHFKSGICSDEEMLTLAIRFFDRSSKTWNAWRAWSDEQDAKAEGFFEKVATPTTQKHEAQEDGIESASPSPLYYAAKLELTDVANTLIKERGYNVNEGNGLGLSALDIACRRGNEEVVKALLDAGADVSAVDKEGWTPLLFAVVEGRLEVAKLLIEKGARAMDPHRRGWMPLHSAIWAGHTEMVKLLIENGASVVAADRDGWVPLHYASCRRHVEIVKLLIEKGSDIMAATKAGVTPLHSASGTGHTEVAKLLVEEGASIMAATWRGFTPLHTAAQYGHCQVTKLLIEKGATVRTERRDGWTPLHSASANGHTEVVKLLLANPDIETSRVGNFGHTALFVASRYGQVSVVQILLADGRIDPGFKDWSGSIALFAAVRNGHFEVVKLLLTSGGTRTESLDGFGLSLFWWARRTGNSRILQLLEQHAERTGSPIPDGPSPLEPISVRFDPQLSWCDACTLTIPEGGENLCKMCQDSDFHLCAECFDSVRVQCHNGTHVPAPL